MPNDKAAIVGKYKQSLSFVLQEYHFYLEKLKTEGDNPEDRAYRIYLHGVIADLETQMTLRGKVKEGRPKGTTKKRIIEQSKERQAALKRPLNPGAVIALERERNKPKVPSTPVPPVPVPPETPETPEI